MLVDDTFFIYCKPGVHTLMATYLITGGCGFIGSHLADALIERGDHVRILDDLSTGKRDNPPPQCELIVGDVADPKCVAEAMKEVDGCWHLAAIASVVRSNEEWLETHRVNLTGTVQVLDQARFARSDKRAVPVVYASSAAVFGDNSNMPLNEMSKTQPLTAYGADKLGSELHARVGTVVHGVPTVGLRFFNVYGKRQDPSSPYSGVISIFSKRILEGKPITIHGDGGQTRDFVSVDDVVRFLLKSMGRGHPEPEIHHVCTGIETSITELAETLFQVCERTVPIEYGPGRSGDVPISLGDPTQSTHTLNLTAKTPLLDGLKKAFL